MQNEVLEPAYVWGSDLSIINPGHDNAVTCTLAFLYSAGDRLAGVAVQSTKLIECFFGEGRDCQLAWCQRVVTLCSQEECAI